jgi:hypothetical protein
VIRQIIHCGTRMLLPVVMVCGLFFLIELSCWPSCLDGFEAGEEESMQFTRYKDRFGDLQVTGSVIQGKGKSKKAAKTVADAVASQK